MALRQSITAGAPPRHSPARAPAAAVGLVAGDRATSGALGRLLYLLFIVSWFLHLGARFPVLGAIRFDLCLVIGIAVLSLTAASADRSDQAASTTRKCLVAIVAYAILTIPLVEWPGSVIKYGLEGFIKAAVFYFFTNTFVRTKRDLVYLLAAFMGCQVFRVMEPVYLHVTEGYWGSFASMADWESMTRLAGAPFDVINPNSLAFVIVTALVFCHFLCPLTKLGTIGYLGFLPVAIYALALTASRTGMLAFSIVIVGIWWKSRRKVILAAVIAGVVVFALPLLSDNLQDRYLSIFSSNTKNGVTASERTEGLRAGLVVVLHRPLFGHGLGTSREANANFGIADQISHNLYIEVAEELGFIGLLIFLAFMVSLGRELKNTAARSLADGSTGLVPRLADALQVWLIMNFVFSFASFGLMGYEWYMMAGLSEVVRRLATTAPVSTVNSGPVAVDERRPPAAGAWTPGFSRSNLCAIGPCAELGIRR